DCAPETDVSRSVVACEHFERDVAQFVKGGFCGCSGDQHQYEDAGQNYFGFHSYWWSGVGDRQPVVDCRRRDSTDNRPIATNYYLSNSFLSFFSKRFISPWSVS